MKKKICRHIIEKDLNDMIIEADALVEILKETQQLLNKSVELLQRTLNNTTDEIEIREFIKGIRNKK